MEKGYNESVKRGTADFPLAYYYLDASAPRYTMAHHWHHECEMIRVLEGSLALSLDGRRYSVGKGDIVFINSGVVHGAIPTDCRYECIVFDIRMLVRQDELCPGELKAIAEGDIAVDTLLSSGDGAVADTVGELFKMVKDPIGRNKVYAYGLLYCLFGIILRENRYTARDRSEFRHIRQMKRVLKLVQEHYGEALTLGELAHAAGMTPKYFCAFFKKNTGKTPIDYLNQYRIEKAVPLLHSGMTVTETAYRCGFNDLSYFIRVFRKYKGVAPGKDRMLQCTKN